MPSGPALVEVVGFGGVFFGGNRFVVGVEVVEKPRRLKRVSGFGSQQNPAVRCQMKDIPPFDHHGA